MDRVTDLPNYLKSQFHDWKKNEFTPRKDQFEALANNGQSPETMVISCCDSRVHPNVILGTKEGELFIHRSVANYVPPHNNEHSCISIAAAVEFAVAALHIKYVVVMGHSHCGGIKGCHARCESDQPAPQDTPLEQWLEKLTPIYDHVKDLPEDNQLKAMEQAGVKQSLQNLLTFPVVKDALNAGTLSLHGLWFDIATGDLESYDPTEDVFHIL